MSAEQNKTLMRRFYDEVVNRGNLDMIDELASPDFVDHEASSGLAGGREGVKQFLSMLRTAFPDLRMNVEDVISEGDKAVAAASVVSAPFWAPPT